MNVLPHNLLLADDDLDDCLLFREAIEEIPLAVSIATVHDGVQLMQLLLNANTTLPDALYLDLNMPRKNGFECLTELKQNPKLSPIPVIVFSTSFHNEIVNQLYTIGAHYYIRKPGEFAKLKQVLHQSIQLLSQTKNIQPKKEQFVLNHI